MSFKDIRQNGYHVETINEKSIEYLHITNVRDGEKCVLEKLPTLSSGLYYTSIKSIESNAIVSQKLADKTKFIVWHDRLGHPGSTMMRRIIENSHGHPLKNEKILQFKEFSCAYYSQGKLITKPTPAKIRY